MEVKSSCAETPSLNRLNLTDLSSESKEESHIELHISHIAIEFTDGMQSLLLLEKN